MAMAEVGRYDDAMKLAEAILTELARGENDDLAARLRSHLDLYSKGMGCREPWPETHPLLSPPTLSPTTSSVTPR